MNQEATLTARMNETIPEITEQQRLDTAVHLAALSKGRGLDGGGLAVALFALGLDESPLVGAALARHGHRPLTANNPAGNPTTAASA